MEFWDGMASSRPYIWKRIIRKSKRFESMLHVAKENKIKICWMNKWIKFWTWAGVEAFIYWCGWRRWDFGFGLS